MKILEYIPSEVLLKAAGDKGIFTDFISSLMYDDYYRKILIEKIADKAKTTLLSCAKKNLNNELYKVVEETVENILKIKELETPYAIISSSVSSPDSSKNFLT